VVIFKPEEGGLPLGSYRTATDITAAMLASSIDLDDPSVPRTYFERLFQTMDTDRERIQEARRSLDYPKVAEKFRMIDDYTESVVITNYGAPEEVEVVSSILAQLRSGVPSTRSTLRQLQPYIVPLYRGQTAGLERAGLLVNVMPGLWEWRGDYHPVRGIGGMPPLDPNRLIV
jgi:CRISPR-associated endonuclease/helicase Cas3